MKPKNTLLLLIIAIGIFAFIRFYESGQPTTLQSRERAGKVVQFDRDKITAITIKNKETKIELRKQAEGRWAIEAPVKDRADSMAINQLFTTAENLKSEATVGTEKEPATKEQLREFGVADSEIRLTMTGDAKPVELLFGKDAAVEGKLYVREENVKIAHVIGTDLKNQVTKKADDFRDRKLTDLIATQVTKLAMKTAAGEIEVGRKDQHWSLEKPLKARGNDQKVGDVIAQIANAQIDSFVTDSSNLNQFGLQEPRGTVSLFVEGQDKPTVLQIGQALEKDAEKIYVKLSSREAVCVVPKTVAAVLDTKPNDLRDRNLVRVQADIVDRMTLESPGKEKIVLARSGESWVRKAGDKDQPINVAAATRLLSDLQNQQVGDFVADVATDLPKYGLDQPTLKITLSSFASENTAETKAGEKPIVSVLFGKVEGGNVYAKLDDEPYVVALSSAILESAMTDPLQWQELAIYKQKPEDLTALEIARAGEPTLTLERDKDKKWVLAKGDGQINQVNVQSMANTLAGLRAVKWIGATQPEHGLAEPLLTVSFKAGGTASGKLSIAKPAADESHFATAEGLTGTFALSRPDVTAFQLPLLEKPAAPAAPAVPTIPPPATAEPPAPATPAPPAPPTPPAPADAPLPAEPPAK